MLAAPGHWFARVPGVLDTGSLNAHFVRDVGCAYLALAVASALAARRPREGFSLLLVVSTFLSLHALLHVWDVATGRLPGSHLLVDAPGILLPAAVAVAVTFCLRPRPGEPHSSQPTGQASHGSGRAQ